MEYKHTQEEFSSKHICVIASTALLLFVSTLYYLKDSVLALWRRCSSYVSLLSIPGPGPSLLSPLHRTNFLGRSMAAKYGPVYKIWHYFSPVVVLGEPEAIKAFYKDHYSHHRDPDFSIAGCAFKELYGHSLGVQHGRDTVKEYRSHFEPYFSSAVVYDLQPVIGRAVHQWVTSLQHNIPINLYHCGLTDIAFKVLSSIVYGEETMERHLEDIKHISQENGAILSRTMAPFSNMPFYSKLTGMERSISHFNTAWETFNDKLLEERRSGELHKCDGLFYFLYDQKEAGLCSLSKTELLQTMSEILLLNVDISQAVSAFLIADIARHQHVQTHLLEEIEQSIGTDNAALVEDLAKTFPYLNMVQKESARMHPALSLTFPERTVKEVTILGQYSIPKHTLVCVDPYTVNYNEDLWREPEQFQPERFAPGGSTPACLFRFGLGPRKCLGYRVALAIVSVTAVTLLQNFKLKPADPDALDRVREEGMCFFTAYLAPDVILEKIN